MVEDLVVGTGATAAVGDTVTVNYVGTLTNGTKFDSSYDRGQTFSFRVGTGQVIAGWDQGVPGMKVGGKRRLTIPPSLGYGSQARGSIPANSTLLFDVDLVSIAGWESPRGAFRVSAGPRPARRRAARCRYGS